jgi:transposase-like protein
MCPHCKAPRDKTAKYGFFNRITGHKPAVQRYICHVCKRTFSSQTGTLTFRERKPHLTQQVMRLTMEGLSMRACARSLSCTRETVARKLTRLGQRADALLQAQPIQGSTGPGGHEKTIIFDEMETFEHSKCKPVSIAIAVEEKTRRVVAVDVAVMPAKGKLAEISRKKYGKRADHRPAALKRLLSEVRRQHPGLKTLKSDESPRYPRAVREVFGVELCHLRYKGRRGCVVGQGELKRGGWDPLFSLNHTCAMFRDHLKRLSRRTWCTTKVVDRLAEHVSLYAWWHNQRLLQPSGVITMP